MSVDVVVVTYESAEHLRACLEALPGDAAVMVVDNASTDGSADLAEELGARVLRNGDNRGFAAAANQGARGGSGELVLFLNPDAVLPEPDLRALEQAFAADDRLGAASPRLLRADGTEQRAAWPLPTAGRTWLEALGAHRLRPAPDGYLIGACLCVRRAAFEQLWGFDERFWLYGEDADLGRRLADDGWSFRVVPEATARHVGGASGEADAGRTFEHFQRGAELYVAKHHGSRALLAHRLGLLVGSALRVPLLRRRAIRSAIVRRLVRVLAGVGPLPPPAAAARLLDAFEVERPAPIDLSAGGEPLFAGAYRRTFGPTGLYDLADVALTTDGAVLRGRHVLEGVTLAPHYLGAGARYGLRARRLRQRRFTEADTRYVAAFNLWSANYFHWLCDVLPRLYLLREQVRDATIVLPSTHAAAFVDASLAPFGAAAITRFGPNETAWFRRVLVPGHVAVTGNYHEPTMRGLAGFLRAGLGLPEPASGERLLYATRRDADYRHATNEAEVASTLAGLGFEVVDGGSLSFAEQVRTFSSARLVVGIMGANLANALFLPPGAALLELGRAGDRENQLYWALASAVGARFYAQQCDYVETRPGNFWDLRVDVDLLRRNVERILGDAET